jgi:TPR repeat protein
VWWLCFWRHAKVLIFLKCLSVIVAIFLSALPALAQSSDPLEQARILFKAGDYIAVKKIADDLAAENNPQGFILLGNLFQKGLGVEVDLQQAQVWYQKGADAGDGNAELALALLLLNGTSGQPNVIDGAPWLQRAAEKGLVKAAYNLGLFYTGYFGTQADWPRALEWFTKAADKGHARSQYYLGLIFLDGKSGQADEVIAADWFAKAAVQGMPEAALEYGVRTFRGEGVEKDEVLGTKWLKVAAVHGNAIAQNRLARVMATGVPGVDKDPVEAMKWNILASKAGRADAEIDAAAAKTDPALLNEAKKRAAAFSPAPDPTVE